MSSPEGLPSRYRVPPAAPAREPANLAEILERVLDKGIVIAGDIRIDLLDIELLTIRLRLLVASVDKAKEMGIDWWERDGGLSSLAGSRERELEQRLRRLEAAAGLEPGDRDEDGAEPAEARGQRADEPRAD